MLHSLFDKLRGDALWRKAFRATTARTPHDGGLAGRWRYRVRHARATSGQLAQQCEPGEIFDFDGNFADFSMMAN